MAEEQDQASKTEPATQKKLEDARKKGEVAKTPDAAPLLAMSAAFAVLAVGGGYLSQRMAEKLLPFWMNPHEIEVEHGGAVEVLKMTIGAGAPLLAAVLGAAVIAAIFANIAQHGFIWTGERLKPQWSKVSIAKGFKRIFGIEGWVQFIKSLLKISAVGAISWWVLNPRFDELPGMALLDPAAILPLALEILRILFIVVIIFMLITAGADFMWQRYRFLERQKMTKDEMKQEHKNTEGDPIIKAKQRQIRMERSRRRMMQAVPEATVVIMNPTHYAVALFYEQDETPAPKCVAKGLDSLALKIREIAEEAGVPVIEEPPLARALYASIDVDEFIPPAHYQAVARIIGFVMSKAKGRSGARPSRARTAAQ